MGAKVRPPNFKGKKGRSGRKTIAEEVRFVKEKITTEALIELAKNKVFKQLNQEIDFNQTKEMALPVVLKGITDKSTITLVKPQPIDDVLLENSGLQENKADEGETKDSPGRNECLKDGGNNPVFDSVGPK